MSLRAEDDCNMGTVSDTEDHKLITLNMNAEVETQCLKCLHIVITY